MSTIGLIAGTSGLALTSELHKRGHKVALVMGKALEPGHDLADHCLACDFAKHQEIIDFFKQNEVSHVLVGTGPFVAIELIKALKESGIECSINLDKFALCKNKYVLKDLVASAGIATPKYVLINRKSDLTSMCADLSYPLVIKAVDDAFTPIKANNKEEFDKICGEKLDMQGELLVEEFISGNDFTVLVKKTADEEFAIPIYWSKGGEDESMSDFGGSHAEPLTESQLETLYPWVHKVAEITGCENVFRIDLIYKDGVFYLLEINTIIVSSLTSSSYAVKHFQARANRAEMIVDCALKQFGLETKRQETILILSQDGKCPEAEDDKDKRVLCMSVEEMRLIHDNKLNYPAGLKMFSEFMQKRSEGKEVNAQLAELVLMAIITADADEVLIHKVSPGEKKEYIVGACEFLNCNYRVID